MPLSRLLGRTAPLLVERLTPYGAALVEPDGDERSPSVLLPRGEVPEGTSPGQTLEVFVYLDSEDRPTATLREPKLELGEVAFLTVTDLTDVGAFVDWGLTKELLVPFARQTRDLSVGDRHPIGLYLDNSGRLAGTMRVSEMLRDQGEFTLDEWVWGEAWRKTPGLGVFVIVERSFVGLLPESEPHSLARGDAARFRVAHVFPDGKIELSLRGHAHEQLDTDADLLLSVLRRPGAPRLGDGSSPEQIRAALGLSKKAFKRAAGRLLKRGEATLDGEGYLVVTPASPHRGGGLLP